MQHTHPPRSLVVVGAGVFGLSTFHALLLLDRYRDTELSLVDPFVPDSSTSEDVVQPLPCQNIYAASIDSSRIVRTEYANHVYAALAAEAQQAWRQGFGQRPGCTEPLYWESGIVITADEESNAYVRASQQNSSRLGCATRTCSGPSAIKQAAGLDRRNHSGGHLSPASPDGVQDGAPTSKTQEQDKDPSLGVWGYENAASGWTNAGTAMQGLLEEVVMLARDRPRVRLIRAQATSLHFDQKDVRGVVLKNGTFLHADQTILAVGAHCPAFVDLRGRCQATGQVLSYLSLTEEEADKLADLKILLNFSNGMFFIPPVKTSIGWEFKVARHGFGYVNPVEVAEGVISSIPDADFQNVPREGEEACRRFLAQVVPWLADRPFSRLRICWYADTPTGDFLIAHHPSHKGLMLATGGSGHGFKFLPVIGSKVVDALEGRLEGALATLWRWRESPVQGVWVTQDGSRGSEPMMLSVERRRRHGEGCSGRYCLAVPSFLIGHKIAAKSIQALNARMLFAAILWPIRKDGTARQYRPEPLSQTRPQEILGDQDKGRRASISQMVPRFHQYGRSHRTTMSPVSSRILPMSRLNQHPNRSA